MMMQDKPVNRYGQEIIILFTLHVGPMKTTLKVAFSESNASCYVKNPIFPREASIFIDNFS